MTNVSNRVASMSMSPTIAMAQKSRDMRAKGIDIINLGIGEPDFNTPDHIKIAANLAIKNNYTYYPPVAGYVDLREAIVAKLKRENSLDYGVENIVVSCGAKQSIFNVFLSTINTGDEVIIPVPYWVSYSAISELAGGKNVFIPTGIDQKFKVLPGQLEAAITHKTKAIIFSSPSNPTGSIYSREELKKLAEVLEKHPNILIVSDEIYEHINFLGKHESIAQFDSVKDRVIVINGVSKGYAMTGWRLGYMAGPEWLAKATNKLQGQMTSGVCTIAQKASVEALNGTLKPTREMQKVFKRRRDLAVNLLNEIKGFKTFVPEGAFYLFPDVSGLFSTQYGKYRINNSEDFCMYILEEALVATVMGSAFGDDNCIRISYATSDELLEKALKRIKIAVAKLN